MERLVGNPVHVYTLLWRLVTRLPGLRAEVGPRLAEEIEDITSELEMPDLSDVEGATQALVRIQFAYRCGLLVPGRYHWHCTVTPTTDLVFRLDPAAMARGHIYGVDTQARLTSGQMMDIARSRCRDTHVTHDT